MQLMKKSTGDRYTNTRVRVMKSKLLKREDYARLLKMSVDEIARFLQDTDYKKEIDSIALQYRGVNLIEYALNKNLAYTFHRIYGYSLKDSKQHIANYLKKWDIWNIKTILRGKRAKASKNEIFRSLVYAGTFKQQFLNNLVEKAESYEQAIESFKGTEYYEIMSQHKDNPIELEDSLDQYYYKYSLENLPEDLKQFVQTKISILNELNLERAKKAEIKVKLIAGGLERGIKLKKQASLEDLRLELEKKMVKEATSMLHEFSRSIRPVVGYFMIKENEVRNLRLLVRGKHSDLPHDLIERNLVI